MNSQELKKFDLPDAPGVYYFMQGRQILYIGKATSLKDRVKSYFNKDIFLTRGPRIVKMLEDATRVKFVTTDSVLEALLLEVAEIKRVQPIYNQREKDGKSYNYITITKEDYPRVLVTRGSGTYGPFPKGSELKEALRILRKIFPFRDKCNVDQGRPCFNAQIKLCPGVCYGAISKREYRKSIKHLGLFLSGKKDLLLKGLEKEMSTLAKQEKFEEAEKIKRRVFALEHIQDIALIKADFTTDNRQPTMSFRVEAYDIAHLSGKEVVGVMTVVVDGEIDKSQYRKFKIKKDSNDDTGNLREVLERRLAHTEWTYPDLIVIDGGQGQLNMAKKVLKEHNLNIDLVSVVKDDRHKAREILNTNIKTQKMEREILLANAEAHRFAIGYHRKLRSKGFRI